MDKEIRKKVLLDIFGDPVTLIPVVGGLSALLLSWATGGGAVLTFLGLGGILGGIGWLATRLIFGIEQLTEDAYKEMQQQKEQRRERELDDLDTRLVNSGRDPRDQNALRSLRAMEAQLRQHQKDGTANSMIVEKLDELFKGCVTQLKHRADLYDTSRSLSGEPKRKVLDERQRVLEEVEKSVGLYGTSIEQMKTLKLKSDVENLSEKRDELERSLEIAKRVEQRMSGIGRPDKIYDESEFQ